MSQSKGKKASVASRRAGGGSKKASGSRSAERVSHETVRVEWDDLVADIDTKIAPLVLELWKVGIRTRFSCEDAGTMQLGRFGFPRDGWVQVVFERVEDAAKFLNVVTRFEPGGKSLYNRISHQGCRGVRCWEYEVQPVDFSFDETAESYVDTEKASFDFRVAIYFPRTDLPVLLERLREAHRNSMLPS